MKHRRGKKRRRKRQLKRQMHKALSKPKPGVKLLKDPFAEVPQQILHETIVKMGRSYEKQYEDTLPKLRYLIHSVNPLHLLSIFAAYGLFVGISESGKISKQPHPSILQGDVELLQALILIIPSHQLSGEPATPEKVRMIWDGLINLREAFSQRRLACIEQVEDRESSAILYLQEHVRINTQSVRNWGYFQQVVRIVRRLYGPLDDIFKRHVGLSATDLICVFMHLVTQTESAMNQRWQVLKPVFASKTIEDAIMSYYAAFPEMEESPSDLVELSNQKGASLHQVLSLILCHSDLMLMDMFTFSIEEVAVNVGLKQEDLRTALSKLELSFGELKTKDPEHFFLDNPVWKRPVISLGDDTFFCAMPQVFFSFVFQIMDGLLENDTTLHTHCSKRRAEFLEEEVKRILVDALPGCESVQKFKWKDVEGEFETDLIVKVSSFLLIVEAKSGGISSPALRGAPDRILRHIKEQVLEPAIQSQRLAERILNERNQNGANINNPLRLPFRVEDVHQIIRLSVTLELFAAIQSSFPVLKDTGCIEDEFPSSPTMTLADLETVLDILPTRAERMHYLLRRNLLEKTIRLWGDELDWLGLYLETGLNLGEVEFNRMNLKLMEMSKVIEEYYNAQDAGIKRKKPILKKTNWWADILQELERRATNRWLEATAILLNYPVDEQYQAERAFKRIKKNVRKNWLRSGTTNTVIMCSPKWRTDAVVLLAFRERQKDKRYIFMENIASSVFEKNDHVDKCLVLGVNIDRFRYPYNLLSVFDRKCEGNSNK